MKTEVLEKHLLAIQAKLEEAKAESLDFDAVEDKLLGLRDGIDKLDDEIAEAKEKSLDFDDLKEADALIEEVFSELRHEENIGAKK